MHSKPVHAIFNGRRLSGLLSGEGQVTVVLEAGLGGTIEDWARVQPEVAKFARVFSYDRAGLGQSEKAPTPRTCEDFTADLRGLLQAAGLKPPYILVAHSWSGLNARWHASRYPQEIAGMILVDAAHEDRYEHFEKVLPAERIQRMWDFVRDPSRNDEGIDRVASMEQVRQSRGLFHFP